MTGRRIGIIGLGLLGASIAMRARALGARVIGIDIDAAHAAYARANGIIDDSVAEIAQLFAQIDVLILAVPVADVLQLLSAIATQYAGPAARLEWIIDVGSTKASIMAAGAVIPNFIGTHPIAGSERRGPQAGRRDLFAGKPWVCTPPAGVAVPLQLIEFIGAMGAVYHCMDAADHDQLVARTSHLPQALATVLAALLADRDLHGMYGSGLHSMTRLAASPFSVWASIFADNRVEIAAAIAEMITELEAFAGSLAEPDPTNLQSYFARAHRLLEHVGKAN